MNGVRCRAKGWVVVVADKESVFVTEFRMWFVVEALGSLFPPWALPPAAGCGGPVGQAVTGA